MSSVTLKKAIWSISLGIFGAIPSSEGAEESTKDVLVQPSEQNLMITHHKDAPSITALVKIIEKKIEEGIDPTKICVVFDIDGTLTRVGDPSALVSTSHAEPRGLAIETIAWLKEMKVNICYSSAWASMTDFGLYGNIIRTRGFGESLSRLDTLGLQKIVGDIPSQVDQATIKDKTGAEEKMIFVKHGQVASVRYLSIDDYFRQKLLSPYFIFGPEGVQNFEAMFLAEDSSGNIRIGSEDIQRFQNLYPGLKTVDFLLLNENEKLEAKDESEALREQLSKYTVSEPENSIMSPTRRRAVLENIPPITSIDERMGGFGTFGNIGLNISGGYFSDSVEDESLVRNIDALNSPLKMSGDLDNRLISLGNLGLNISGGSYSDSDYESKDVGSLNTSR